MIINLHKVRLKEAPSQISRGVHDKSTNLFVELISDGITAWSVHWEKRGAVYRYS